MPDYIKIKDPMYRADIRVVTGEPDDVKALILKKIKFSNPELLDMTLVEGNEGASIPSDEGMILIWIRTADIHCLPTIVHECFHATSSVLDRIGLVHNTNTEEVYAYYQMWLFNEVLKKLSWGDE